MNVQSSPLLAMGAASLEALQRQFRAAPGSIDPSWRLVFEVLEEMELPEGAMGRLHRGRPSGRRCMRRRSVRAGISMRRPTRWRRPHPPLADDATPLAALERAYRGSLTVETAHMDDPAASAWLRERFEAGQAAPDAGTRRAMLRGLLAADEFERFLGVKFPTKKRFGAEGAEALIPLLRRLLEQAALAGVTQVVMGTMHRGRLSILANVLGKPAARIIAEIKGLHPFADQPGRAGDVPYHLGLDTVLDIGGRPLRVSLLANPSHLEAVDALVLGKARALQDVEGEGGRARVLPLILHTDAAVIGQGVVAEALQLWRHGGLRHRGRGACGGQ
jgi:2-oxoglutarate dehydrogenase E1 component